MVANILKAMTYKKDPTVAYENEPCCEEDPNWYLFGIYDDGIGNKRLGLLIYLDNEDKNLIPVAVYKNNPSSN